MAVRHLLSARHRMLVFIDVSITYSKTGKECVDTTSAEDRGKNLERSAARPAHKEVRVFILSTRRVKCVSKLVFNCLDKKETTHTAQTVHRPIAHVQLIFFFFPLCVDGKLLQQKLLFNWIRSK